jgi:outer membrane protein OmpA-like peptidoglycan-associated protein
VPCAFGTDETTLSEDGLHALREVLAWNQALLETSTTTIAVDGYASRLGPPDHNQHLSELRRQHVVEAIASLVPGGPLPSGTSHGETAAAAAGVADGDNAREWRRADVRINGVLVLQLYAPITETIGTEPVVTADPDHAD